MKPAKIIELPRSTAPIGEPGQPSLPPIIGRETITGTLIRDLGEDIRAQVRLPSQGMLVGIPLDQIEEATDQIRTQALAQLGYNLLAGCLLQPGTLFAIYPYEVKRLDSIDVRIAVWRMKPPEVSAVEGTQGKPGSEGAAV